MISISFYKVISNRFFGLIIASIILGSLLGVWFIEPESRNLAPIISIIFMENTLIESNGLARVLRPLTAFILLVLISVLIFLFLKKVIFKKR
tara:strand:- start:1068 stop:1343 length:276 start_codon:yes stop_codon:yes gene_type:complete